MDEESRRLGACEDRVGRAQARRELGDRAETAGTRMQAGRSVRGAEGLPGREGVRGDVPDILEFEWCHGRLGQKVECVPHEGRTILRVSVSFSGPGAIPGTESALRISLLNKCVCMCVCIYIAGRDLYQGSSWSSWKRPVSRDGQRVARALAQPEDHA